MKTTLEKNYTHDYIAKEFSKLTQVKQIEVLYEALDYMQQYNGRSKTLCIAMALGYENYEGGVDTYTRK
jgi:hypothetical protein|tara:strand:- start:5266 stop:5472 length:207 start_codon:yes stop_codon:yes gene_type:complete